MNGPQIEFDLIFEAYSWRNKDDKHKDSIDMGLTRNNHTNVWSELTRHQMEFIRDRLTAYLDDTSRDQNMVYLMGCGYEFDSPYRLSAGSRVHCSQHGFQWVKNAGDMLGYEELLPRYRKPPKRVYKKR